MLTPIEMVEYEGLAARNRKGLIVPGSDAARRLAALAKGASGERDELDARVAVASMGREQAMAFYSIKRRAYYEMEALGREVNDSPPWGEPLALEGWFAKIRAAGLRKHSGYPGEIQRRIEEARISVLRAPKSVISDEAPELPEAPAAPDPLVLDAPASTDEILTRYLRIAAALGKKFELAAAAGDLDKARTWRAEMDVVTDRARQWSLNAPKMREAEAWVRPDVFAGTARAFFDKFWQLIRREITARIGPESTAVIEEIQRALPDILPPEFN